MAPITRLQPTEVITSAWTTSKQLMLVTLNVPGLDRSVEDTCSRALRETLENSRFLRRVPKIFDREAVPLEGRVMPSCSAALCGAEWNRRVTVWNTTDDWKYVGKQLWLELCLSGTKHPAGDGFAAATAQMKALGVAWGNRKSSVVLKAQGFDDDVRLYPVRPLSPEVVPFSGRVFDGGRWHGPFQGIRTTSDGSLARAMESVGGRKRFRTFGRLSATSPFFDAVLSSPLKNEFDGRDAEPHQSAATWLALVKDGATRRWLTPKGFDAGPTPPCDACGTTGELRRWAGAPRYAWLTRAHSKLWVQGHKATTGATAKLGLCHARWRMPDGAEEMLLFNGDVVRFPKWQESRTIVEAGPTDTSCALSWLANSQIYMQPTRGKRRSFKAPEGGFDGPEHPLARVIMRSRDDPPAPVWDLTLLVTKDRWALVVRSLSGDGTGVTIRDGRRFDGAPWHTDHRDAPVPLAVWAEPLAMRIGHRLTLHYADGTTRGPLKFYLTGKTFERIYTDKKVTLESKGKTVATFSKDTAVMVFDDGRWVASETVDGPKPLKLSFGHREPVFLAAKSLESADLREGSRWCAIVSINKRDAGLVLDGVITKRFPNSAYHWMADDEPAWMIIDDGRAAVHHCDGRVEAIAGTWKPRRRATFRRLGRWWSAESESRTILQDGSGVVVSTRISDFEFSAYRSPFGEPLGVQWAQGGQRRLFLAKGDPIGPFRFDDVSRLGRKSAAIGALYVSTGSGRRRVLVNGRLRPGFRAHGLTGEVRAKGDRADYHWIDEHPEGGLYRRSLSIRKEAKP